MGSIAQIVFYSQTCVNAEFIFVPAMYYYSLRSSVSRQLVLWLLGLPAVLDVSPRCVWSGDLTVTHTVNVRER